MRDHILITRPQEDAISVSEMVRDCGFVPFSEPMLTIVPSVTSLPDLSAYQALVFTSVNAVRVVSKLTANRSYPLYVVGSNTREEAERLGWSCVRAVCPTGYALNDLLEGEALMVDRPVLHLSGEHIATAFSLKNVRVERLPVYRADKVMGLSDTVLTLLDEDRFCAVMFFSVRTAESFIDLLDRYERTRLASSIKVLCLSKRVLESVRKMDWQDVQCARTPDKSGMYALLRGLSGGR